MKKTSCVGIQEGGNRETISEFHPMLHYITNLPESEGLSGQKLKNLDFG